MTRVLPRSILTFAALVLAAACSRGEKPAATTAPAVPGRVPLSEMPKTQSGPILERIKVLSGDEFEGRKPGTKGEELTVKYLEDEFKKLGLKPGNTDGTYVQQVPLVGITAHEHQALDASPKARRKRRSSGATRSSPGPSTSRTRRRSRTPKSSSRAMA